MRITMIIITITATIAIVNSYSREAKRSENLFEINHCLHHNTIRKLFHQKQLQWAMLIERKQID